jgi:lipoyl(octanoyl) transferase
VTVGLWRWLGRAPFGETARAQERLRMAVADGSARETLLCCEHAPVVTLGRSARPAHLLASRAELARRGVAVETASRGGDVTYHGPGQLVGYPIVRLRHGVVGHVTAMARAIAAVLAGFGVAADWRRETPGLWIGARKICAFGVHVRHGVAIHGFALNVGVDLSGFDLIVPCGLPWARPTSMALEMGEGPSVPTLALLASRVARALGAELGIEFAPDIDRAALHDVIRTRDEISKAIEMSRGITRMIGA